MRAFLRLSAFILLVAGTLVTGMDILYAYAISRHPLLRIPEGRHYRYLVLGDSRVSSLLEKSLDSLAGGPCIVLPNYGGNIDDMPHVLGYFFDRGNTAETVVCSIDLRLGSNTGVKHEWQYHAHAVKAAHYLMPRIPFRMYALHNATVTPRKVWEDLRRPVDSARIDGRDMGLVQGFSPHAQQSVDYSRQPFRIDAVDRLRELSKEKGVRDFRLLIAPYAPGFLSLQSDPTGYKDLLRKGGYRVYDLSTLYADTAHFADYVHLKRKYYRDFTATVADSLRR